MDLSHNRLQWTIIVVLLAAFALRLWGLGADSLWYDETVTLFIAQEEVPRLVNPQVDAVEERVVLGIQEVPGAQVAEEREQDGPARPESPPAPRSNGFELDHVYRRHGCPPESVCCGRSSRKNPASRLPGSNESGWIGTGGKRYRTIAPRLASLECRGIQLRKGY